MTYFRNISYLAFAVIIGAGMLISGCSDDDGEISPSDHNYYTVTAYNAGEGHFGFSYSGEDQVFCYETDGCETESGFTSWTLSEGGDSHVVSSDPERFAVGFIVDVNITRGEGYFEIEALNIDAETFETTDREVIHTSDAYSEDESFTYNWGETEGFDER